MTGEPVRAFSNGTAWELWSVDWCDRCLRDAIFRNTGKNGCPILFEAMFLNQVPKEWTVLDEVHQDYACSEFKPPDAPKRRRRRSAPPEEPKEQGSLFPRSDVHVHTPKGVTG